MSTLGQQIRELRIAHNISMLELAKAAKCCAATVKRVEDGAYCSKDLAIKAAIQQMVADRQTNRVMRKRLVIVGSCRRISCGINLVASPEDVPPRWVVGFHVDCGGYCPECSAQTGLGDSEKAQMILEQYPVNLFIGAKNDKKSVEENGRRKARLGVYHPVQNRQ